jgi:glycosyltransferase involved in cell wall biosynthesis
MNKLISVAMATYNGSKYLSEQLDSIINQAYKNIEIIIVDDFSSDNTIEIIKNYQQHFSFIHVYQNSRNIGVVKSFEKAMSLCSGEYIALSDQDDVWLPHKLATLLDNIGDALLIHSDAKLKDEYDNMIAKSHFNYSKKTINCRFSDYLVANNVTGCCLMLKKELLELMPPIPDGFYIHDHYLALVASYYGTIKFLDKPLVIYRQHLSNSIGAKHPKYSEFIKLCKTKADSYDLLLSAKIFPNKIRTVKIIRDYRLSIYTGSWVGDYSIFRLLFMPKGLRLVFYYLLMAGFKNRNISKTIYNFIYKIK